MRTTIVWGVFVVLLVSLVGSRVAGDENNPVPDATIREPDMDLSDAYEFNETPLTARHLHDHGQSLPLTINPIGDVDWFTWKATNSKALVVMARSGALNLTLWDATGSMRLASSKDLGGFQFIIFKVTAGTTYAIRVISASKSTHSYTLQIFGPATDGTSNSLPETVDVNLVLTESVPDSVIVFNGDFDPDGHFLTAEPHGSLYGRIQDRRNGLMFYLPGTSIAFNHKFTYVVDDGNGGRTKGVVNTFINPLPDNRAFGRNPVDRAEGFGAGASGGRSSPVFVVTNLEDGDKFGPEGSLRRQLEDAKESGGGIIVFQVAGTINLVKELFIYSNTTVAGETAPNPGITVRGRETRIEAATDVIVRYMRFRHGVKARETEDALTVSGKGGVRSNGVIIDHCSMSWGIDGTIDIFNSDNTTMQWCIVAETLLNHSLATLVGNDNTPTGHVSLHHNLWAHAQARQPWIQDNVQVQIVNNVIYNWGNKRFGGDDFATKAGVFRKFSGPVIGKVVANIHRNYFIAGFDSAIHTADDFGSETVSNVVNVIGGPDAPKTIAYLGRDPMFPTQSTLDSNFLDRDKDGNHDGSPFTDMKKTWTRTTETNTPNTWNTLIYPLTVSSPQDAYEDVLDVAGAYFPLGFSDATDERIINDVRQRTGKLKSSVPIGE